jgi:thiol-disulfide isomerase/thioredoxin
MIRLLLICFGALALAACQKASQPQSNQIPTTGPGGQLKGVDRSHRNLPAPKASFNDPDGKPTSLEAFAGKPVLVNLWASWCAPCVKELPTLDQFARAQKGKLNVVAISQDMDVPQTSVVAFLKTHGIVTLTSYQDPKMALSGALGAEVLPTSILYDSSGREIWRYVGDQDWTSAGAARLVAEAGATKGP